MQCPKCQMDNPEINMFCRECGAKLSRSCTQCGAEVLPADKFCGKCGQQLSIPAKSAPKEPSFDEKLAKIQKYLPSGLTEKILSQRDRIEGERKQVTVLFTDMAGYTPLTEKLDPEEAYSLMDQVYEILIHKVTEYGGTVNELTGDGIMALFGAPIAQEDAPQRAIRASLAIHREMVQFNDKMRREKPGLPPLRMRAGIHSGPVVVGTVGNDLRVDFKAVGDTVNLASRMEQMAEPGATYVSVDTFTLTEGLFRFEGLGEKEVKGKEKPIRIYRVIAPSTSRTRFDVSAERGLTPFVGRERERELLLDAFERARAGRGQAVSIVSEAGMGKSRLLYEFRKAVLNEDMTFLEGKCLSFGRGVAYQPISDILKSNFDIREGDWDSVIRNKVTQGLQAISVEEGHAMPYLLELLSAKDSGIEKIQLSPEGKRDRTIETLKKILLKGSEIRPVVVAIEDLHWIDRTSEDVLKYLLESIPGARVLLIFTYRTEYIPTWGARTYHNQLLLNRLSNRESLLMVNHLLGTDDVESALEEVILEKTEGIPFFVEEFIKSLKDLRFIERKDSTYRISKELQAIRIPSTIQDIIMARVDALPEGAKEVLQVGSLIEREFSHKLVESVMKLPERELLHNLSALKDAELLYERGLFPDSTFIFKHALTREVVGDSLLGKKKKLLHEEIGKALEEIYKDNLEQQYGVLASHFMESENFGKAAEYSRQAARRAEKAASLNDAVVHGRNRVACLEELPQTEDVQRMRIDARTLLGMYMTQMGFVAEAYEMVAPIFELARSTNYKKRLCQIYAVLGNYYHFEENYPEAFKAFEEALKIADEVNDIVTTTLGNFWFGDALAADCQFERAAVHMGKSIDVNVAVRNLWGTAVMKSALAMASYFYSGKWSLGSQIAEEALRVAEESGDAYSKALAYLVWGYHYFGKHYNLEEAERYALKGVEFCENINMVVWNSIAQITIGEIYLELGKYSEAKEHYEQGTILERSRVYPSWVSVTKAGIIKAKVMNGEKDFDLSSLYVLARNIKTKMCEGWIARYIGDILLLIDDQHIAEADDWIRKAIEADERNGMRWYLARDYALYADFFKKKGDLEQAREKLQTAIGIFRECGADGWVKKYEEELGKEAATEISF